MLTCIAAKCVLVLTVLCRSAAITDGTEAKWPPHTGLHIAMYTGTAQQLTVSH